MTYFRWWGFSINEGQFPNIHIRWGRGRAFYLALSPTKRWFYTAGDHNSG